MIANTVLLHVYSCLEDRSFMAILFVILTGVVKHIRPDRCI
jgi:hypothetical protein